jgi:hypothetical protein
LSQCKHDVPPDPPPICAYDSSVEEMKKWYYFKTGTWWVYQEQSTGALDTVTVYHHWDGINTGGFEGFEWSATSSFDGYSQYYTFNTSFSIHCLSTEECTCHKIERARSQPGDFIGADKIFLYPLIEGNYTACDGGGWCTLDSLFNIYQIDKKTFLNVAVWNIPNDDTEDEMHSRYWIGENVGIVRRQILDSGADWILIESNITQ